MEEIILSLTSETADKLNMYDFLVNNALGGAVVIGVAMVVARYLLRALFASWFGKRGGAVISTLVEATVLLFVVASAWQNPGVVVAGVAWGAIIFKSIIQGV